MIKLEDVLSNARKRFTETHGVDSDAMPADPLESIGRDFDRVAATFVALVDEVNAELERIAGAILERVGARDLTPADAAKIAGTAPPEPVTTREITGNLP